MMDMYQKKSPGLSDIKRHRVQPPPRRGLLGGSVLSSLDPFRDRDLSQLQHMLTSSV